jgi:hypothetical protein
MKTRHELETYIRFYIPKGWVGPIREFDFAPLISDEDMELILRGEIPNKPEYKKWYIQDAIKDFLNKP